MGSHVALCYVPVGKVLSWFDKAGQLRLVWSRMAWRVRARTGMAGQSWYVLLSHV